MKWTRYVAELIIRNHKTAEQLIAHGREIPAAIRAKVAPDHIKTDWPVCVWTFDLLVSGSCEGKSFKARPLFITRLRTTPEALL